MHLGKVFMPIDQTNQGNAFKLTPTSHTKFFTQASQLTNRRTQCYDLDIRNLANNSK